MVENLFKGDNMNCKRCGKKLTWKDLWLNRYRVCILCSYKNDEKDNNRTIESYQDKNEI